MFAEEPVEKREQLLRDNCDQIVERSYTRKFEQHEVNARREELENVSIQVSELEDKLAEIRADYKGRIKPLLERRGLILDELKARGEYVKGDCFKFVDVDEGKDCILLARRLQVGGTPDYPRRTPAYSYAIRA
jgi:hypothetical protein